MSWPRGAPRCLGGGGGTSFVGCIAVASLLVGLSPVIESVKHRSLLRPLQSWLAELFKPDPPEDLSMYLKDEASASGANSDCDIARPCSSCTEGLLRQSAAPHVLATSRVPRSPGSRLSPSTPATFTATVELVPIKLVFADGNVALDPTQPTCTTGTSALQLIANSPIFQPAPFFSNGQYLGPRSSSTRINMPI